jgi:hypothetical protein
MRGLAILLFLAGCSLEPSHDQPLTALPQYPGWYQEVESCSGHLGNYAELRFWALEDGKYAGRTFGSDIFLSGSWAGNRKVVEHEMLHSLIGDGGHQSVIWWACGLHPTQIMAGTQ